MHACTRIHTHRCKNTSTDTQTHQENSEGTERETWQTLPVFYCHFLIETPESCWHPRHCNRWKCWDPAIEPCVSLQACCHKNCLIITRKAHTSCLGLLVAVQVESQTTGNHISVQMWESTRTELWKCTHAVKGEEGGWAEGWPLHPDLFFTFSSYAWPHQFVRIFVS